MRLCVGIFESWHAGLQKTDIVSHMLNVDFHIKQETLDSYSSECNIRNCYICSTGSLAIFSCDQAAL